MNKHINIFMLLIFLCACAINGVAQSDTANSKEADHHSTVNIAYGIQDEVTTSSSITTIDGDLLQSGAISSFGNSLYGKLPGLQVFQGAGHPGFDAPTLRVRGAANAPLIIIDGFERDMKFIAPDEIESVSVLKDATAVALYGMKGANGVILITTKRGSLQKGELSVSLQSGVQLLSDMYEVLGAEQQMRLYNQAAMNDGQPAKYTDTDIAAAGSSPRYPDIDWRNLVLNNNTNISRANFGLIGGTEIVKYFFNFGLLYNNGVYKPENPDMNSNANQLRMNIRSNLDINVTKSTLFSLDLAGNINRNSYPSFATGIIWNAVNLLPPNAFNVKNPDGSYGGSNILPDNPVAMIETGGRNLALSQFLNAGFRLKQDFNFLAQGLSASIGYVLDNGSSNSNGDWRFFEKKEIVPGTGDEYVYNAYGENTQYNQWSNASSTRYINFDGTINYNVPEFGGNKIDILLRYQTDQQYRTNTDLSPYLTENYGVRALYNKDKKYLLEIAASYYGSDQYAEGKQFGLFPSLSAGWVFSNEGFLSENQLLTFGKLKASYGLNGYNRYVNGRYPFAQFYVGGGSFALGPNWDGFSGLQMGMLANPGITWEKSTKLNVGMELGFIGQFSLVADYYVDNRSGILFTNDNHPATLVTWLPFENIGEISFSGLDLQLSYKSGNENFGWFADFMFSYFSNTLNEIGESKNSGVLAKLNRTGNPMTSIYGYEVDGYFESEADIAASPIHTFGTPRIGDLKYKDLTNDGFVDSRDATLIGDYWGNMEIGFNLGINYRGFDFSAMLQARLNRDINLNGSPLTRPFIDGNAVNELALEEGFPTLSLTSMHNYQISDYWIRNGNFLKVRNLEIGYSLPQSILQTLKTANIRVFIRGVNILTFSKWKYTDPEFVGIGYPPLKSYLAGVNVNF